MDSLLLLASLLMLAYLLLQTFRLLEGNALFVYFLLFFLAAVGVSNDAGVPTVANFRDVGGRIFQHLLVIFVESPMDYQRPNWPPHWGPRGRPGRLYTAPAISSLLVFGLATTSSSTPMHCGQLAR